MRTLLFTIALLPFAMLANGEDGNEMLDFEPGSYEGYCHVNVQGAPRLGEYRFSLDLKERLAPFDGKAVRVEVTKTGRRFSDVDFIEIGEIRELTAPPMDVEVWTRPSPIVAGESFTVFARVTDRRSPEEKTALELRGRMWKWDDGARYDAIGMPSRATFRNQAYFPIKTLPGESWTDVVEYKGSEDTQTHELTTRYEFPGWPIEENSVSYLERVTPIHCVKGTCSEAPAQSDVSIREATFVYQEKGVLTTWDTGWEQVRMRLVPRDSTSVRVPTGFDCPHEPPIRETYATEGGLLAFDADGKEVELEAQYRFPRYPMPEVRCRKMSALPSTGAEMTVLFRERSRFAKGIKTLKVRFLTEEGIETLVVTDNYRVTQSFENVPFGDVSDGVQLRIRPETEIKRGARFMFHVQAINVDEKPKVWWLAYSKLAGGGSVEIDGVEHVSNGTESSFVHGWAGTTFDRPEEFSVQLPDTIKLESGKHTIRFVLMSKNSGFYKNAQQQLVPLLNGRVVSNEITFEVE